MVKIETLVVACDVDFTIKLNRNTHTNKHECRIDPGKLQQTSIVAENNLEKYEKWTKRGKRERDEKKNINTKAL